MSSALDSGDSGDSGDSTDSDEEGGILDPAIIQEILQNFDYLRGLPASGEPESPVKTLAELSMHSGNAIFICEKVPDAVSLWVSLLLRADKSAEYAACALANLAMHCVDNKEMIHKFYDAIPLLVSLLSREEAQEVAARALANVVHDAESSRLIRTQGAIPTLVKLLASESDSVKSDAALTLHGLVLGDAEESLVLMGQHGAIPALVALLVSGEYQSVPCALMLLEAFYDKGGLDVQSLVLSDELILRLVSLSLLGSEESFLDTPLKARYFLAKVSMHPDAIRGFVSVLSAESERVAEYAVCVLANLAMYPENRVLIGNVAGALSNFVRMLSSRNEFLQSDAVRALVSLAVSPEVAPLICNVAGALSGLVSLLSRRDKSAEYAACALANLATHRANRVLIRNLPGALSGLAGFALRSPDSPAKNYATEALINLGVKTPVAAQDILYRTASLPSFFVRPGRSQRHRVTEQALEK